MSERDIVKRLRDTDYRGPMQHLRNWSEIDLLHDEVTAEILRLRSELADAKRTGWIAGRDAAAEVAGRSPVHSRKPPRDTSSWAMGVEDAMIDIAAYIREQEPPA